MRRLAIASVACLCLSGCWWDQIPVKPPVTEPPGTAGLWCEGDEGVEKCWAPINELDCSQPLQGSFSVGSLYPWHKYGMEIDGDHVTMSLASETLGNPSEPQEFTGTVASTREFCEAVLAVPTQDWKVQRANDGGSGSISLSTGGAVVERQSYLLADSVWALKGDPMRSVSPAVYDQLMAWEEENS